MIGSIRMRARSAAILLWTLVVFTVRLACVPVAAVSTGAERGLRRALYAAWARGILRIFGVSVSVHGTPPRRPFLLVSNHLSHIDTALLASRVGCVTIARHDVADWPVVGFMAKWMNVIFVNRRSWRDSVRVNQRIAEAYADGDGIAIFAEGGTSRGLCVQPFKSALLEVAAANGWPVHYATIHYTTPAGSPPPSEWVCWHTPIPFVKHVFRMLRHPRFHATLTFGPEPILGDDRKRLAEQLHDAVAARFTPVA